MAPFLYWCCGHVFWTINSRLQAAILQQQKCCILHGTGIVLRHISTTLAVRTNKHSKLHQNRDTMGPRNQRRCASYHKPTSWTRLMCFSYTAHLRSCTALSTTHPFDASESKGYMAALSTELSAKWHKQKEKRGLNLERWHWKQMERFETVPTPSQGWRSVSITSH